MIQSARLMTSRLCSITTIVLPGVAQPEEQVHQPLDVHPVQPGGRLVQDVEGVPLLALAQLKRELEPLGLAAR